MDRGAEIKKTWGKHAILSTTHSSNPHSQDARVSLCFIDLVGWWMLVVWNIFLFFHRLGIIIPTDFHIFQRGTQTTNQYKYHVPTNGTFLEAVFRLPVDDGWLTKIGEQNPLL